jgi:hypothetical protein
VYIAVDLNEQTFEVVLIEDCIWWFVVASCPIVK